MDERPDTTGLWPSLRTPATADRVAEQIVGHIDAQRLRSGDKLPSERELAGLLGVSRPSLREALRSLQERGLIRVRHGSGAFVAEPAAGATLRQRLAEQEVGLRELFDMREVIELPAAEWAARRQDPERLAAVRAAFEELDAAAGADEVDYARLQELDAAFHLRIVEAAGNRFLSQTLGVLHEILATGMRTTLTIPGRLQRSRRDHERILAAILAGDAAGARRAAKQHVTGARRAALGRLADEKGVVDSARAGR